MPGGENKFLQQRSAKAPLKNGLPIPTAAAAEAGAPPTSHTVAVSTYRAAAWPMRKEGPPPSRSSRLRHDRLRPSVSGTGGASGTSAMMLHQA